MEREIKPKILFIYHFNNNNTSELSLDSLGESVESGFSEFVESNGLLSKLLQLGQRSGKVDRPLRIAERRRDPERSRRN
jgi:hypothetical protein